MQGDLRCLAGSGVLALPGATPDPLMSRDTPFSIQHSTHALRAAGILSAGHRPQTLPVGYANAIAYQCRRRRRQGERGGHQAEDWPERSVRRGDVANVAGGGALGTIIRLGGLCTAFCQRSEVACRGRRLSCSSG